MKTNGISYERRTRAGVAPPITTREIAAALLDPSEFAACSRQSRALIIDGVKVGMGMATFNRLKPHIKKESLNNGSIRIEETAYYFHWSAAHKKICNKYGLTSLYFEGERNRVTGILVSSNVSIADPDAQVRRYASVIRALKKAKPKIKFALEECVQTTACDPRLTKVLRNMLHGKQPESGLEAKAE